MFKKASLNTSNGCNAPECFIKLLCQMVVSGVWGRGLIIYWHQLLNTDGNIQRWWPCDQAHGLTFSSTLVVNLKMSKYEYNWRYQPFLAKTFLHLLFSWSVSVHCFLELTTKVWRIFSDLNILTEDIFLATRKNINQNYCGRKIEEIETFSSIYNSRLGSSPKWRWMIQDLF